MKSPKSHKTVVNRVQAGFIVSVTQVRVDYLKGWNLLKSENIMKLNFIQGSDGLRIVRRSPQHTVDGTSRRSSSFPVFVWLFSCRASGRQQQTQEGAHGLHQGADPRTGVRVRSPQLPDPTETLRNRCQPRPDRTPGTTETTSLKVEVFWVKQEYL